jgi:hypothetical protein
MAEAQNEQFNKAYLEPLIEAMRKHGSEATSRPGTIGFLTTLTNKRRCGLAND